MSHIESRSISPPKRGRGNLGMRADDDDKDSYELIATKPSRNSRNNQDRRASSKDLSDDDHEDMSSQSNSQNSDSDDDDKNSQNIAPIIAPSPLPAAPAKSIEGYVLIVSGLHEETQEDDLVEVFGDHGTLKNIHLNLDRRTGLCRGYAFLEYSHLKEAEAAVKNLHGEMILGERVLVNFSFIEKVSKKKKKANIHQSYKPSDKNQYHNSYNRNDRYNDTRYDNRNNTRSYSSNQDLNHRGSGSNYRIRTNAVEMKGPLKIRRNSRDSRGGRDNRDRQRPRDVDTRKRERSRRRSSSRRRPNRRRDSRRRRR